MSERDMELVKACRGVDNVISAGMSANAINNPREMAILFQDGMIAVRNMAVQQPQQPQAQFSFTLAAAQPKPEPGPNVPS